MRVLLLLLAFVHTAGCVAVDVDVAQICSETTTPLSAPAFAGEAQVDLAVDSSTIIRDARTTVELDLSHVTELAVTIDGTEQRITVTDADRALNQLELSAPVQQPKFKVRYRVVAKPGVETLSVRGRTCAASSTHIEKRVL